MKKKTPNTDRRVEEVQWIRNGTVREDEPGYAALDQTALTPNAQRSTFNERISRASTWKIDCSNSAHGLSDWWMHCEIREPQTILQVSSFAVGLHHTVTTVRLKPPNHAKISFTN